MRVGRCVCVLITSIQSVVGDLMWWLGCRFVYWQINLSRRATPYVIRNPPSPLSVSSPNLRNYIYVLSFSNMLDSLHNFGQRTLRITASRFLV